MPESEFALRQNDTASPITAVLLDDDGEAVDLAGATVRFRMHPIEGGTAKVDAVATNEQTGEATKGHVSYSWQAANTDTYGLFLGAWPVTFAGGEKQTFPNGGYILVRITQDTFPIGRNYVTVEEVKASREVRGSYVDEVIRRAIAAASREIDLATHRHFWADDEEGDPDDYPARLYTPVGDRGALVIIDDLIEIAALETDTSGDATYATEWEASDYALEPLNAAADGWPYTRIVPRSRGRHRFPCAVASVRVRGRFGWEAVPEPIEQATLILASRLLIRSREAPFAVVTAGSEVGAVSRIARTDPDVFSLIKEYVR